MNFKICIYNLVGSWRNYKYIQFLRFTFAVAWVMWFFFFFNGCIINTLFCILTNPWSQRILMIAVKLEAFGKNSILLSHLKYYCYEAWKCSVPWCHCGWSPVCTVQASGADILLCWLLGCAKPSSRPRTAGCELGKPQSDAEPPRIPCQLVCHAPATQEREEYILEQKRNT